MKTNAKIELYVSFLYPGIVLKGDSFLYSGEKIWDADIPIDQELIENLKRNKVKKIYYVPPHSRFKNNPDKPLINDDTLDKAIDISKEIENAVKKKSLIPEKAVNEVVENFIDNISSSEGTILNLLDLKDFDEYTYTHSINVCLIAILFAKKLSYSEKGLKVIGVGALLHDIGKQIVSKEIINKPGALTEEEMAIAKKHTVYGYEIVKSQSSFGSLIEKIVLLHHERYSGKGYPFGMRGEQIGEISQIVSIADTFDAITSPRPYRAERQFWYALSQIKKASGVSFAPRLAKTFVQDMPRYLTDSEIFKKGSFVVLNSGEVGEIIGYRYPQTLRPIVNIYINSRKEVVRYPIPVDLEFDDSRFIENVLESEAVIDKMLEVKGKLIKGKVKETSDKAIEQAIKELKDNDSDTIPDVLMQKTTPPPEENEEPEQDEDFFVDNEADLK